MQAVSPRGRHALFIYYRVRDVHAGELMAAATAMQATLQAVHAGLVVQLLRRPEAQEGLHTWMETYGLPPDADPSALAADVERAARGLAPWLVGARHVEHFVACAS